MIYYCPQSVRVILKEPQKRLKNIERSSKQINGHTDPTPTSQTQSSEKDSGCWGTQLNCQSMPVAAPKLTLTAKERESLQASAQYFGMKLKSNLDLGALTKERPVSLKKSFTPRGTPLKSWKDVQSPYPAAGAADSHTLQLELRADRHTLELQADRHTLQLELRTDSHTIQLELRADRHTLQLELWADRQTYPVAGAAGRQSYPAAGAAGRQSYPAAGAAGRQPYPTAGAAGRQPYPTAKLQADSHTLQLELRADSHTLQLELQAVRHTLLSPLPKPANTRKDPLASPMQTGTEHPEQLPEEPFEPLTAFTPSKLWSPAAGYPHHTDRQAAGPSSSDRPSPRG
nr:uncharacterized protein LOC115122156 [Oncorhynchus nerka]